MPKHPQPKGSPVNTPKAVISLLTKGHPHSATVLKAFAPLLDAQNTLAAELPALELPPLDRASFAQGKAWMSSLDADPALYCDEPFLQAAPKAIAAAAAKGMPEIKADIRAIGTLLGRNPALCRELAAFRLGGRMDKMKAWAKKQGHSENTAALFALHLAGAAARRVMLAAAKTRLPTWERGYCPICGNRPHATSLQTKEGHRFLQCSLCRHEWRFSRTTCPVCEQDALKDLPVFFTEDHPEERAEACNVCKHYLLGVDMRASSGDVPLELSLLCMMPLDILMQEKGYTPAVAAE